MSSYSCARGYKIILTSSVLVSTDVINLNKYDGLQLTTRLPAKNGLVLLHELTYKETRKILIHCTLIYAALNIST